MPTYEYRCDACGHAFERFQKINDDPVRTCPDCGEDEVERLISPGGGLVFKGSGFYATDYRDSGPGGRGKAGGPEEAASGEGEAAGSSDGDAGDASDGGEGSDHGDGG